MSKAKKQKKTIRYNNLPYLVRLGAHCKKLRERKGYSIDRMAKESEQLSPSVIHRLETASAPVTVYSLIRYAEILELPVKSLFDFHFEEPATRSPPLLALDSPLIAKESFRTLLPLYSLKAAAGYFAEGAAVEPEAWVQVGDKRKWDKNMFVARAKGRSMEPQIFDGDFLVFRAHPEGTRQGKIVLAQFRGLADPETGGSYTVKRYHSNKKTREESWQHQKITLSPLNPDFEPIEVPQEQAANFSIIAELIENISHL